MKDTDLQKLTRYAKRIGFNFTENQEGTISFYPRETNGREEDIYLSITSDLVLQKHKFLTKQEFKSLTNYQVTKNWVSKFLEIRSLDAKEDNDRVLLTKKNKKTIEENKKKLPIGAEEELDKKREAEENRPSPLGGTLKSTPSSHGGKTTDTVHLADITIHEHDNWDQEN